MTKLEVFFLLVSMQNAEVVYSKRRLGVNVPKNGGQIVAADSINCGVE